MARPQSDLSLSLPPSPGNGSPLPPAQEEKRWRWPRMTKSVTDGRVPCEKTASIPLHYRLSIEWNEPLFVATSKRSPSPAYPLLSPPLLSSLCPPRSLALPFIVTNADVISTLRRRPRRQPRPRRRRRRRRPRRGSDNNNNEGSSLSLSLSSYPHLILNPKPESLICSSATSDGGGSVGQSPCRAMSALLRYLRAPGPLWHKRRQILKRLSLSLARSTRPCSQGSGQSGGGSRSIGSKLLWRSVSQEADQTDRVDRRFTDAGSGRVRFENTCPPRGNRAH